ncbi:hemerythrin domain-containing protein [Nonomuraea maritima]|uniref:hemerythrin domain-containing protein n=1 Tax=Nonomuraea maritima TaxID=683260 RepID=UPI0037128309
MRQGRLADTRDMFAMHTMFRREYGNTPDLVRAARVGDLHRATVVADHIALLNHVLHGHHTAEDKYLWPLLLERVGAELAPIVLVMEEQHTRIHHGYVRLNMALAAWREDASARARAAVARALDELVPVLDTHLSLEEERVVPLIERHLSREEYARAGKEGIAHNPPDAVPVIVGMLMYESDLETIDGVIAALPADLRLVIRDLSVAAYASYAQKLYGTAMPPRVLT